MQLSATFSPERESAELSILVLSCDAYSDAWDLFFHMFHKHWPDCPFRVFLGNNVAPASYPGVVTLHSGTDSSWSDTVLRLVEQIPTKYVLVFLEDHFLLRSVMTRSIVEALEVLQAVGGGYVRLDPSPPPDDRLDAYPNYGVIRAGSPYRVSLHEAIWRRDVFLSLLKPGESAWNMELIGSRRSDLLPTPFLAARRPLLHSDAEGIVQRTWTRSAVRLARREGFSVDLTRRRQFSIAETLRRRVRGVTNAAFALLPWSLRRALLRRRLARFASPQPT